jgi:Ca2+-binding RTX toxin-like protein
MDYRQLKTTKARRQLPRIALAAAALLAAVAAGPASAHAGVVIEKDVAGPFGALHVLRFAALSGEDNKLGVGAYTDGTIKFEDAVAISNYPSERCYLTHRGNPSSANAVACHSDGVDQIQVLAGNGVNEVTVSGPYTAYISGVSATRNHFRGGEAGDILVGDDGNDVLEGGGGTDRLEGRGGLDQLRGGDGTDVLLGGDGFDLLDGGGGGDTLRGGAGIDSVNYGMRAHAVNVSLDGVANDGKAGKSPEGDDVKTDVENVTGGSGDDTLVAASDAVANTFHGGLGNDTLSGGGGGDVLHGGAGSDPLSGGGGADRLYAEAGSDLLGGGPGGDVLSGGADPDVLGGGTEADYLAGGAGEDTVTYAGSAAPVTVDIDGPKSDDGAAGEGDSVANDVENLIGSPFDDTLTGNAVRNVIDGRAGGDRIDGRADKDQLLGKAGDDTLLSADDAADNVYCGDGRDATQADPVDVLSDCEADAPAGTGQAGPGVAKLGIGPARVRLTRRGVARLRVVCPADVGQACSGALLIRRKIAGRVRTVGSHRFSIAAGRRGLVRVRVSRALRQRLTDAGMRVRVVARTANVASAGSNARVIRIIPTKGA